MVPFLAAAAAAGRNDTPLRQMARRTAADLCMVGA